MRFPSFLSRAIFLPLGLATAACSGGSSTPHAGPDGGEPAVACPASPPGDGTPCTPIVTCEYGANAEGACATLAACASSTATGPFTWHVSHGPPGCGTHGATCPASFTARAEGAACTTSDSVCDYAEGRCACAPCLSTNAPSNTEGVWACEAWSKGGAGCPTPRPLVGTACSAAQEGTQCSYAFTCTGVPDMGPGMTCTQGIWTYAGSGTGTCGAPPSCPGVGDAGTD